MATTPSADHDDDPPLFSAVSSSARQLYQLLRCIAFAPKAQVSISEEGLRFSVEEHSIMEGLAFLDKSLFTSYNFAPHPSTAATNDAASDASTSDDSPVFQISLAALLETLQIFNIADAPGGRPGYPSSYTTAPTAFDNRVLGLTSTCRLSYAQPGAPLCIILEEAGVTTTCELTTYEPAAAVGDIPFARDQLALKIIMRASWLHDAVTELASTNPERLTLTASADPVGFALGATGSLGSAVVDFRSDLPSTVTASSAGFSSLLETFTLAPTYHKPGRKLKHSYKFGLVRAASRAMAVATKVSIRADEQGMLSLQFMIEVDGRKVSFVDFRFVPLVDEDAEDEEREQEEGLR
ncbi:checkpoint clamp complex protein Rad1 [Coniosporium apollinis]|uniref:Checkpoint clamp complex protein Rad1 n=1 Tax=Coniosporium apollinis TaxID=61459 RepID=A0ABQ9NHJ2_9PEZI|nr:checkpoint clamp complex protein Rad1 [Coniosporium apollinis]